MKNILIYTDKGADPFCIESLVSALKQEKLDEKYVIRQIKRDLLLETDWQKETHLLIFPGGRDIPYHRSLKGSGNHNIRTFVENGGNFLGICAGGYYGSSIVEFEQGGPLEVLGERELKFFPGIARGPAYGLRRFDYLSDKGAQIAKINLASSVSTVTAAYYNGGCSFDYPFKYSYFNSEESINDVCPKVLVMARYADIEGQPAAIVKCHIGAGSAILSGVHPEYSAYHECTRKHIKGHLLLALKKIESERRCLFDRQQH